MFVYELHQKQLVNPSMWGSAWVRLNAQQLKLKGSVGMLIPTASSRRTWAVDSAAVYNPKTTALKPQNCPEHITPPSSEKLFPYVWLRCDLVQTRGSHMTSASLTYRKLKFCSMRPSDILLYRSIASITLHRRSSEVAYGPALNQGLRGVNVKFWLTAVKVFIAWLLWLVGELNFNVFKNKNKIYLKKIFFLFDLLNHYNLWI